MDTKKLDKQKAIITMEPNNYTEAELLAKETEELNKIKVVNDILDAQDTRGRFERFLKDKLGPLIPVITGIIAIILFVNTYQDKKHNEFKEAQTRYTSELDLVKLVWNDIRDSIHIDNAIKSAGYIIKINSLNDSLNKIDNKLLGIDSLNRPIQLLISSNPRLLSALTSNVKQKTNNEYLLSNKEIRSKKSTTATNKIAGNFTKIYIQYSNKEKEPFISEIAEKLKSFYIVPPIDYVKNNGNYKNEIRYYSNKDSIKAAELSIRLNKFYSKEFVLKNINKPSITNTIEVWIDNK